MNQTLKTKYGEIYESLKNEDIQIEHIIKLAEITRLNRHKLSEDAMREILRIILIFLEECIEIKDEEKWVKANGDIFAKNCYSDEYFGVLYQLHNFSLETLIKHLKSNMYGVDTIKHPYYLKNVEITLNKWANTKHGLNLNEYAGRFAPILEKALEL